MEPTGGLFGHFFLWVNEMQRSFYREMTGALKAMRQDGAAVWLLIGLSFTYGIFHAAGPGHGKAVISSYMLANETLLRRGVDPLLRLGDAAGGLGRRAGRRRLSRAARHLGQADRCHMVHGGGELCADRGVRLLAAGDQAQAPARAGVAVGARMSASSTTTTIMTTTTDRSTATIITARARCARPAAIRMRRTRKCWPGRSNWRSAWAAVAAVGLRPCSGALIVLTFALLNGLYVGGIISVFAMALGTAITVSTLATLAVTAKNVARARCPAPARCRRACIRRHRDRRRGAGDGARAGPARRRPGR